jgi:Zn ribbon nucleic-acid-binding protein
MNCPACNSRTKRLRVHDDVPFAYHECCECGWDDYDEQATLAARLEIGDDDDGLEEDC